LIVQWQYISLYKTITMNKAQPVYHSGLAIVQLSTLPGIQYDFLSKHVSSEDIIEVDLAGGEKELCISYVAYEHCFRLLDLDDYESYFDSQI